MSADGEERGFDWCWLDGVESGEDFARIMTRASVGQSLSGGRLRWHRSLISADGSRIEEDGVGFPPANVRQQILEVEGEWEVLITAGDHTRAAVILREALGVSPRKALEHAKDASSILYCGTKTEARWLSEKLSRAGIQELVQLRRASKVGTKGSAADKP